MRNSSVGGGSSLHREREVAGAYAEVRDVPDPVGPLGLDAERVVHVERVRPGLHEPRGRHRRRRHRRAEPRHLLRRAGTARSAAAAPSRALPQRASSACGRQPGDLDRLLVDVPRRVRDRLEHERVPRLSCVGRRRRPRPRRSRAGARPGSRRSSRRPGVGVCQPSASRPATVFQSWSPSALRSASRSSRSHSSGPFMSPFRTLSRVSAQVSRMRTAAAGVVGDGVGQAEAAHQVEGRLHQLAVRRARTRRRRAARRSAGGSRDRPAARAARPRPAGSASVRAATQSSSAALKTGEAKWSPSICSTARVRRAPARQRRRGGGQLGAALLGEVLDGGDDQGVLGREVVQLRAPADPGPLGDQRGRRTARSRARPGSRRWPPAAGPASPGCAPPGAPASVRPLSSPGQHAAPPTNSQA